MVKAFNIAITRYVLSYILVTPRYYFNLIFIDISDNIV